MERGTRQGQLSRHSNHNDTMKLSPTQHDTLTKIVNDWNSCFSTYHAPKTTLEALSRRGLIESIQGPEGEVYRSTPEGRETLHDLRRYRQRVSLPPARTDGSTLALASKEVIGRRAITVFDAARHQQMGEYRDGTSEGFKVPIRATWYMGKSANAERVYCAVQIYRKDNTHHHGEAYAGGGGYCKQSAAFEAALNDAGIRLSREVSGVGMEAVREAMIAIADAVGYRRNPKTHS